MKSGAWSGDWPLSAGWRYPSGSAHFAYDVAMPRGTSLFAPGDGVVIDCQDGAPDPPPPLRYSGMPSNWIILRFAAPSGPHKGHQMYGYWQHLTKGGVKVRKGQRVKKGDLIGKSGSSGNSTGPHLHLVVLKPGHSMNRYTRYAYLLNPSMVAWPIIDHIKGGSSKRLVYVSKLRPGVDNSASVRELRRALIKRGRLDGDPKKPGNKYTPQVEKAVKAVQRKRGWKQTGRFTLTQARDFFKPNSKIKVVR